MNSEEIIAQNLIYLLLLKISFDVVSVMSY